MSVGDNYVNKKNATRTVVECGCCTEQNYPPLAIVRNITSGICYDEEDSVCGKPGDDTFIVCDTTSKGIAKVSVCIDGVDKCVNANKVPGDNNDPSVCGVCPV